MKLSAILKNINAASDAALKSSTSTIYPIYSQRMMKITRDEVPAYLQKGSFYENLCHDDDESFSVPDNCLKQTSDIKRFEELHHLFSSIRYWGVSEIPEEVFMFLLDAEFSDEDMDQLVFEFREYEPYLNGVWAVKFAPQNKIVSAIANELGLNIIKILCKKGVLVPPNITGICAASNDLKALEYFHTQGLAWGSSTTEAAAREGNLDCLRYAFENQCDMTSDAMCDAAEYGHMHIVKYIHSVQHELKEEYTRAAVRSNQIEVFRYLHEQGCEISEDIGHVAANCGSLECLQYMHDHHIPISARATMSAAVGGCLPCLKFLHLHGYPLSPLITLSCAQFGKIACMKYARENGCPWVGGETQALLKRQEWAAAMYTLWH